MSSVNTFAATSQRRPNVEPSAHLCRNLFGRPVQNTSTCVLPSENSAFTRPQIRRRRPNVTPSSALCKNLLGNKEPEGSDVAAKTCQVTRLHQTAFRSRWKCDSEVIAVCCDAHGNHEEFISNVPKIDWIPINRTEEVAPSLLKKFQVARISADESQRPKSPIPFSPPQPISPSRTLQDTSNNRDINQSSNHGHFLFEESVQNYLTPPSSPDPNKDDNFSAFRFRKSTKQSKITDIYHIKKSRTALKHHSSNVQGRVEQENRISLRKRLRKNGDLLKDLSP